MSYPVPEMKSEREQYEVLRSELDLDRTSFMPYWTDCADFVSPTRPRFTITDVNRGHRRSSQILDGTATKALGTLRSGMMSGITSPARQWFRLSTPDPGLAEFRPVKDWLYQVGLLMSTMFTKSNLYNSLPIVYGDLGTFATSAILYEPDDEDIMRTYPIPIGSYWIGNDEKGRVRIFIRQFTMTVYQIVAKFGRPRNGGMGVDWTNISSHVKSLWDRGNAQARIEICHCLHENPDWRPGSNNPPSHLKKWRSVYYERGSGADRKSSYLRTTGERSNVLRVSGFNYFPVLVPRWEVTGEDSWGTNCPTMEALGDVRQLQYGERKSAKAIDKMIDPPMTGPTSLRQTKASLLSGEVTYLDVRDQGGGFRPAHEVRLDINALEGKQAQIRQRISRSFYEDLFLMLANDTRSNITATEIAERKEEKLLVLGPVLEQLNQDLLDPSIDLGFMFMDERGLIPPPPPDLNGVELKVEYISPMAQAQKLIGIGAIERFSGFASQVIQVMPSAADKVDTDQMLDIYSDILSVPPGVVRSDEDVAAMRQQAQQAAQAQAQAEQMPGMARAAKDLASTPVNDDTALTRLIEQVNGSGATA